MNVPNNSRYLLFICCFILSVGVLGREIYIPSLPHLSKQFPVNDWLVPSSLSAFLVGMAGSQLFYGPLSDLQGRKKITLIGILIYLIGNIASGFVSSSVELWICRLIAGIGAGVCTVIPRAILSDIYQGTQLTKALAWLAILITLIPATAPILGGYLQIVYGWQGAFVFLSILTGVSFLVLLFFVPETNKVQPQKFDIAAAKHILLNFKTALKNINFISVCLFAALSYTIFIAYAMLSPYYFQDTLGLSPQENGNVYFFVVLGYTVGAMLAVRLAGKCREKISIIIGLAFSILGSVTMVLFYLFGEVNTIAIIIPFTILMIGTGLLAPVLSKQGLDFFPHHSGTAAALFGSIRLFGSFVLCLPLAYVEMEPHTLLLLSSVIFTSIMCALFLIMTLRNNQT